MKLVDTKEAAQGATVEYVTVNIGDQLFGIPIERAHDVFMPESITIVPMSAPEIAGVLNLRGRIVTAIDMRRRLELPPAGEDGARMAVGIEYKGEFFGLIIDSVGEVLRLPETDLEQNPMNLDPRWVKVSGGVYRLEGALMIVLDVDRVLDTKAGFSIAA
ncbi:MAG: chemotaxis protein CheW [Pseudomonadota bacterium]